ncbi:uncharacterized protein LOC126373468 [Pectinophora gossypiella]|uniref:uncharacterized protein LOC126373468 n=1 Tax=Pectinophora gossypiella TaxID=13191 RepID=UPI00214EA012|nr:uncharacterized protein LOC126373468 [Pectinophora gossypiella]
MKAVLQTSHVRSLWLITIILIKAVRCQDGFSDRDLLRLQQIANQEGPVETITSYSTNIIQRDPSSQSISSVSVQYHMTDDAEKNEEYNRADRGRSRKVYRIKNPFQRQLEDEGRQQESQPSPQDSDGGASNQYAAMQYSLPPEDFLRQMRAENQYYQQQQQPQVSTQAPNLGYTATPQPQYQYSTIAASGYENNPQPNQMPQLEPKVSQAQDYRSIANSYQYNSPNSYVESVQSTPSPVPPYVSTSNNQYVGTPANTYVSSSSPIYLSSPANVQFISSSIPSMPAGTPDYKITSTLGNSLNYDTAELNKKMQIDHYDNSINGIRYPSNIQQQYQSEYPSSTALPTTTPYPDPVRDSWQNNINSNPYPKSIQEYPLYQRYSYYKNQQESRPEQVQENVNSDTHRIGNMPAANNVYLNYAPPDYQVLSNIRTRTRDTEHETSQPEYYSHGEYGWKLSDKKPLVSQSGYASANYPRYQPVNSQPESVAVSQMSFHMDTGKTHNYDHISKSSPDTVDAQEFAKAAAKAHENLKRQQYYSSEYASSFNTNNPPVSSTAGNNYYNSNIEKQRPKIYSDSSSTNPYYYNNPQQDLITAAPYYYANARENAGEEKPKQPFDHDKALKNIVPIDVSNVVPENQQKVPQGLDNSYRYTLQNYNKDQLEQNLKQNFKAITDSFYQDKNAVYGINIKPRPEENSPAEGLHKVLEQNPQYFTKQSTQEQYYGQSPYDNKRYVDSSSSSANYISHQSSGYSDSVQSPANVQQQGLQRPQSQVPTDIASILKLNDIPYRLTQNLPPETFRLNNNNYEPSGLPTPLPIRLNQDVGSHQIDVASSILNKLMLNKQPSVNINRDIDPNVISTINGFKVANPFNVDLRLVADMLKGRQAVDESQMINLREQYSKPTPLKLDISQLHQLLLKNDNNINLGSLDGLSGYSSPYMDVYNGRFPYTGVKYSRSQEEEETVIPIADSSNTHPIGAVIDDDTVNVREINAAGELTAQDDDSVSAVGFGEDRPKHSYDPEHRPDRHRRPNSIMPGRPSFPRKYPKGNVGEPYPLLKPPPQHLSKSRNHHSKPDKYGRRRRVRRPKSVRILKTEPLFEADADENEESVPLLLRPPPQIVEAKSDVIDSEPSSS